MINEYGAVGSECSKTTHPSAVLSTTNTTGPDLGCPDGKPATNCLVMTWFISVLIVSCVKLGIISSDLNVCETWGNIVVTHPGSE
jgi:hypothetical protein